MGSKERKFKDRLYEHITDANVTSHRNNIKLARYTWTKKDNGVNIDNVKWQLLKKCHKYEPASKICDVCLSEKLTIMENKEHKSFKSL